MDFQMKMITGSLRGKEEIRRGQELILSLGRVVLYLFFFSSFSTLAFGEGRAFSAGGPCKYQSVTSLTPVTHSLPSSGLSPGLSMEILARFLR